MKINVLILFFLAIVDVVVLLLKLSDNTIYAQTTTTTATATTVPSNTTVTEPFCVGPLCPSLQNLSWTESPKAPAPSFSIPDNFATPMLWAAGPVSIMAMLFGGSPVNGLYSTSALAVVEFSLCYRDLVDQPLRFPESAWPGFTVGREQGQHIRGALVANMTMQVSLVVVLFAIGAVIATLQTAVKKRRRAQFSRHQMMNSISIRGGGATNSNNNNAMSAMMSPMMAKNAMNGNTSNNINNNNNSMSGNSNNIEDEQLSEQSLFDQVSAAVWYPGSYILVSSIFLEGIVASIIRLFVIGPDAIDVVLSILGCIVVSQIMVVAWTVVSRSFHGAGPVRFCSAYVRVDKKYHESAVTRFLRSKTAATFLLGNYLWCAKKGTEDSRRNVLPALARPAGLLVLPFRARNPEESGVIALATRYFFVECCFAFVFAVCRGIFEPCEVNIWIISGVSLLSTLTLIRVRPFNIPFYNTTAVWSNGAVTASAVCIALYHSPWATTAGEEAKLAGEVIAMMAALGGGLPFILYLIRVVLFWSVNAELCPVGLQEDEIAAGGRSSARSGVGAGASSDDFEFSFANTQPGGKENQNEELPNISNNNNNANSSPRNLRHQMVDDGSRSSPKIGATSPSPGPHAGSAISPSSASLSSSPSGKNASSGSNSNKPSLEDDLELEAILSSEKQPVNWPLRRANDLKLPPLPRADYIDDGNLFVRKSEKRDERPSIFSPEGQMERERLKQRRPKLPELDLDDVILPIPTPTQSIGGLKNAAGSSPSGSGGGSFASASRNSSSSNANASTRPRQQQQQSPSPSFGRIASSLPSDVPKQGTSPLMEPYVI